MFDSARGACYAPRVCAVPAAHRPCRLWRVAAPQGRRIRLRTLGYVALALQAQGAPVAGAGGIDFVHLIANATWIAKSVLLILLLFSAISWGIILYKVWQFRRASRNSGMFLQVFRKSTKFSEVQAICASVTASPLVGIFQAGYAELNLQLRRDAPKVPDAEARPSAVVARPT